METNLVPVPTTPEEGANYLAMLAGEQTGADQRAAALADERKLVPRICISKDSTDFTIKVGDQVVATRKVVYLAALDVFGTRALWAPDSLKADFKAPVCSVGFCDPNVFKAGADKGFGQYRINGQLPYPYDTGIEVKEGDVVNFECARCPFNKYESIQTWDKSKESGKGKACQEARTLFVKTMVKGPALPVPGEELFYFAANQEIPKFATLSVTMGTNKKALESMFLAATARKLPLRAMVFRMTVKHEGDKFKYAVLQPEFAGVVDPGTFQSFKVLGPEIEQFAKRNSNTVVSNEDLGF